MTDPRAAAVPPAGPELVGLEGDQVETTVDGGSGGARRSLLRDLPAVLLFALLLAIFVKTFLVQAFFIPSPSMIPTLEIDDRVLVSKIAYRFGGPEPGDLVVFDSPLVDKVVDETLWERVVRNVVEALGMRPAGAEDVIKRVLAVGGDRLEIRNNRVLVNGMLMEEPYLAPDYQMWDMGPMYVQQDHLWVMGDNRDNSHDSRRFGPVPSDTIVGRAFVRIWPPSRLGGL